MNDGVFSFIRKWYLKVVWETDYLKENGVLDGVGIFSLFCSLSLLSSFVTKSVIKINLFGIRNIYDGLINKGAFHTFAKKKIVESSINVEHKFILSGTNPWETVWAFLTHAGCIWKSWKN